VRVKVVRVKVVRVKVVKVKVVRVKVVWGYKCCSPTLIGATSVVAPH